MNTQLLNQNSQGVDTQYTGTLDPRQRKFIDYYLDSSSSTFANCYQSAIKAGFSDQTARNLTHNKPKWLSETIGQSLGEEPEHLMIKLTDIMNDPNESTQNQLKAIDLMMKAKCMFQTKHHDILEFRQLTIEAILD